MATNLYSHNSVKNATTIRSVTMTLGYDFLPAIEILEKWLSQYQRDRDRHQGKQLTADEMRS